MSSFDQLLYGLSVALTPENLLFLIIGTVAGTIVGVMPGIGAATTIALLLPVTYGMPPLPAFIMLAGIYYGAMYGNTSSAVLINTPGTASAAMTTVDGYPMAQQGRGGAAIAISAIASFTAGTLSVLALAFLAGPLTRFALAFGPAEYFMLMLFAITSITAFSDKSFFKGMLSAACGLLLGTVGVDMQTGQFRFTYGIPNLQDGISFIVAIVGLFAVTEVFIGIERWFHGKLSPVRIKGSLWFTKDEFRRSVGPIGRGGLIGFLIGIMPGAGGTIATILAYTTEQRLSKHPERFGKGAIEGVAAPEAANNAAACGSFVPLLTLGVPGSGTAAILLSAFILYGIQPGPLLFSSQPELAWGLIASMLLGNVVLLVLNLPLVGLFVRVLYLPPGVLLPLILSIAVIGVYSTNNNVADLYLLLAFGVLGYLFRKSGIPIAPLIMGLVLGPLMEQSLRQAMIISQASPTALVDSKIGATLGVMILLAVLLPLFGIARKRKAAGRRA